MSFAQLSLILSVILSFCKTPRECLISHLLLHADLDVAVVLSHNFWNLCWGDLGHAKHLACGSICKIFHLGILGFRIYPTENLLPHFVILWLAHLGGGWEVSWSWELKGELQRTGEESPILFYPNIQLGPIRSVDRKQNLLMSLELADPILILWH